MHMPLRSPLDLPLVTTNTHILKRLLWYKHGYLLRIASLARAIFMPSLIYSKTHYSRDSWHSAPPFP